MKKKIVALVLVMGILFAFGCTSTQNAPAATSTENSHEFNVAMVVGLGGLGDKSFNDGLYAGVLKAAELYNIKYQVIEPQEYSEFNDDFLSLAASKEYDLIIGAGYDAMEGIQLAATEYPDQKFLFIDGAVEGLSNVTNFTFRDNECTFLVGMMAAMKTETGKIGIVMGTDTPDQHVFVAGYLAGAKYVNPAIDIKVKYIGSYSDTATAKELAIALVEDGVDVIYAAAGGAGAGVYAAAAEYSFTSIGTDVNLCPFYPETMFVSAFRNMEQVVSDGIKAAIDGSTTGGIVSGGLAENWVDITNEGSKIVTDKSFFEKTEAAKAAIVSGEITVPSTLG